MTEIPSVISDYLDIVESGNFPVCREQALLAQMVRRVLETEDVHFNIPQLEKYLSYEKHFPFKLFPWEKFFFALHNCLYRADGLLRFPHGFVNIGRGNGKTGYSTFENFCLMLPPNGVKEYHIYTYAMSESQAKLAWEDLYNMLEAEPTKFRRFFKWTKEEIAALQTGSKWFYSTSSPKSADSRRPGKVDFDEYHAYQNYKLVSTSETGLGKKAFPRKTITSTCGNVRGGPFDDLFERAIQILNGETSDNGLLPFICRLDSDEEVHDKRMWHKANPSLRYFPNLQAEIELEYANYVINPVANMDFMTKRMNRPPEQFENEAVAFNLLVKASREFDREMLKGLPSVGGIDYASTIDMISAGLLFRREEIDHWITHTWVCEKSPDLPRVKAPLREWASMGLLTFVSGAEIPPELPAAWLAMTAAFFNSTVLKIGIDKYRYTLLSKALREYGFTIEKGCENIVLLRGSNEMETIPSITAKFTAERIVWGENPLMRWFGNNTKIDMTKYGNMTYQKIEPKSRKTDGFKALAAAECVSSVLDEANIDISPEFDKVYTY